MKTKVKVLYIIAIICLVLSGVMIYQGYDKINNYYNSENYPSLNVNAYVGGDAYNYIINGTYSTAYNVLASGFMISGFLCIAGGMIVTAIENKEVNVSRLENSNNEMNDELPPL